MFFCNIFYKTQAILIKFGVLFKNKFVAHEIIAFSTLPEQSLVSTLPCKNLKCLGYRTRATTELLDEETP